MRLLDLFCGRWGWSRAFAARGWKCYGVDLQEPPDIPLNCEFIKLDVLSMRWRKAPIGHFNTALDAPNPFWEFCVPDFIVASSPCEEFSVHGMKHFHPNPKYPELGIKLFNYTRALCEASGVPFVMENVRSAEYFVGKAVAHSGSFYLWGNAVPPILPLARKGFRHREMFAHDRTNRSKISAIIPPFLANCIASYAERLLEQRQSEHVAGVENG